MAAAEPHARDPLFCFASEQAHASAQSNFFLKKAHELKSNAFMPGGRKRRELLWCEQVRLSEDIRGSGAHFWFAKKAILAAFLLHFRKEGGRAHRLWVSSF